MFAKGDRVLWEPVDTEAASVDSIGTVIEALPGENGQQGMVYVVQFDCGHFVVFESELRVVPQSRAIDSSAA